MRGFPRLLWERGWLLLLPLLALFAHWLGATITQWRTFGLRLDTMPYPVTLHGSGTLQARHLARSIAIEVVRAEPARTPAGRAMRSIELFVAEADLARLESALPYSGEQFVQAAMKAGPDVHEVRIRHRGDNLPHWGHFKKSYRVRVRKGAALDGMQEFNLVVAKLPEQHNNLLACELARMLGVMAPRTELAQVWLNGRFHGLYELVEQLGEDTLRAHGRVPGTIHSGDLVLQDAWTGVPNRVFENASQWESVGVEPAAAPAVRAPLAELVRVLNQPASEAVLEQLERIVDIDAFARLSALEVLTQSHHDDETHNWRLHHDPATGLLEPIVWDLMPWGETSRIGDGRGPELDPVFSHLHEVLHLHAGFLAARHRVLEQFFTSGGDERLLAVVDERFAAAAEVLRADRNAMPQDDAAIREAMASMRRYLVATFDGVRDALAHGAGARWSLPQGEGRGLLLAAGGPGTLGALELRFRTPQPAAPLQLRIARGGATELLPLTGRCRHAGATVTVQLDLVAQRSRLLGRREGANQARSTRRVLTPTVVELVGSGIDWSQLVEVRGDGIALAADAALQPAPCADLFRVAAPLPAEPLQVSGTWDVRGSHVVRQPVRIAPGTVVRMAEGASLRFEAQLQAMGAPGEPIRFQPAGTGAWGSVALVGAAASGSVLRLCEFTGGSRHDDPLLPLGAMLSVHACRSVRVLDCTFRDNAPGGSQVQLLAADAEFERCRFEAASGDALHADASSIVLGSCTFLGAGQDAVELWASRALVTDGALVRTGAHGVSLHEASRALVVRTRLDAAAVGMAATDGSVLHAANCDIAACAQPFRATATNRGQADGGSVHVHCSTVAAGREPPAVDKDSRLSFEGCNVGWPHVAQAAPATDGQFPRGRIVHLAAPGDTVPGLPAALQDGVPGAAAAWHSIRRDVRGVP